MRFSSIGILLIAALTAACSPWGCEPGRTNPLYCTSNGDCTDPERPVCDIPAFECVSRLDGGNDASTDMPPDSSMMCVGSSECPDDAPICGGGGRCAGCTAADDRAGCMSRNPSTPRCDTSSGRCVACLGSPALESADCASGTPICENASCRACRAHSECASGVCKPDGSCAATGEVVYVNKNAGANCQAGGPGTRAMPFCEVQAAALAAIAASKPYVVVAGSPTTYGAISITSGNVTIIGPGKAATPPAMVTPSGAVVATPALLVNTTGTATVTVEGLTLTGTGWAIPGPGVRCQIGAGTATLTVRNSLIQMSGGAGVDSNGCTLTLDRNTIGPSNTGGGVVLGGTTSYTVTNNIIAGNGTGARGVTINDGATGTFAFNTVANNTLSAAGAGGMSCGLGGAKTVQHSIVVGNTSSGGTQFAGNCTLMNVVTGSDSFAGASMLVPDLDASFRLTSATANDACCVDKVSNPTTPNASHDVDGTMRPKGTAHDIGAHEAR